MCISMLAVMGSMSVQAAATEVPTVVEVTASAEQMEPRADIIETVYRVTPDGRLQYRRWNSTRGYWVDPDWLYVPTP